MLINDKYSIIFKCHLLTHYLSLKIKKKKPLKFCGVHSCYKTQSNYYGIYLAQKILTEP